MTWHRPNSSAGKITSPYGPRGPIAGAPDASRYHLGVDLRAGTLGVTSDIYAAAAGTVRRIYKTPLGAWVLELDHGDKVWTRYVHMQLPGIAVKVGDRVSGGQRVAAASNSGAPTVHLHFEVLINGRQVNPVPWLKARGVDLTATSTASGSTAGASAALKPTATISIEAITIPSHQEDPMLVLADTKTGLVAAVFPSGAWALIQDQASARSLRAASGVSEAAVDTVTWNRMCPAKNRLHTL